MERLQATTQIHQNDLAHRLGLTESSTSRLVDQLERKELATRQPDPLAADKRVRLVCLSEHGQKAASQVLAARTARFDELFEAIEPCKHAQILESLRLLREAADELR